MHININVNMILSNPVYTKIAESMKHKKLDSAILLINSNLLVRYKHNIYIEIIISPTKISPEASLA